MRRLFLIPTAVLVLAMGLLSGLLGSPGTARADAPLTATGTFSDANAHFFSDIDGVQTDTFVFANDQVVSDPAGGFEGSFAEVQIFQFDPGNPRNPRDDRSHSFFGFAELAPEQFQVSADLSSATLNALVTVCEGPSAADCIDVTIDLTWAGSGDAHNNSGRSNQRVDGCKIHSTFGGSFRDATATGTLSDGSTDFISGPSDFAAIGAFSFEDTFIGDCSFIFPPPPEP